MREHHIVVQADGWPYSASTAVRELLLAAFDPYTRHRFCYDREVVRPIVAQFAPDRGLKRMVELGSG